MTIQNVIFDFGRVLFDYSPRYLYTKIFEDTVDLERFLNDVLARQYRQVDAGQMTCSEFEDSVISLYPKFANEIKAFYGRWDEMFHGCVAGSDTIVQDLLVNKIPLYGLTNWPEETFHYAQEMLPSLGDFNDIVVSGVEKVAKPEPKIYKILLERNNLDPKTCLFIDDRLDNIETGEALGIKGHHFKDAKTLRADLVHLGLL